MLHVAEHTDADDFRLKIPGESAERSQAKQVDWLQGGHAATAKQKMWHRHKVSLQAHGFVCIKKVKDVFCSGVNSTWDWRRNGSKLSRADHAWCCRSHRHVNVRTYILLTKHAESQLWICHRPLVISKWLIVVGFTNTERTWSAWELVCRTSEGSRSSFGSLQDFLLI